ncbi:MAG TPA: ABC transporter substrate-binding protein [Chloroflexota bacterium]|nr:ABC transporter substrate-binding protein [Chloroflexota bacterium]
MSRTTPRRIFVGLLLGSLLLTLAGCSAPPARPTASAPAPSQPSAPSAPAAATAPTPPPALRDIRTSYPSAAATFAPLWAAYEFGIFEQNGLRASEPVMISGGPANAQTLTAREVDASYTAFSPIVAAIAGGAPIKVVAGFGRGFVHQLFTKAGTGVASAQDMRGKRAGVSRIGTESHTVIKLWARANGLRDDDITYVNAGTVAERLVALDSGAVDLVPLDPPVVVVAEKRGYVFVADLAREPVPWQREALAVPEETLRSDPALAAAIVRSVSEAAYLIRSDRQRFDEIQRKYIKLDDPDALGAAYRASLNGWSPRGRPDPTDVHSVQEVVDEEIPGTANEPYNRFVDLTVLDQLEKEGFFDRLEQQYPLPPGALPAR